MEDRALLRHELEIEEAKLKMAIAKENNKMKAYKDWRKHYYRLLNQKQIYLELKGRK